jgi:hypothetical protein
MGEKTGGHRNSSIHHLLGGGVSARRAHTAAARPNASLVPLSANRSQND